MGTQDPLGTISGMIPNLKPKPHTGKPQALSQRVACWRPTTAKTSENGWRVLGTLGPGETEKHGIA